MGAEEIGLKVGASVRRSFCSYFGAILKSKMAIDISGNSMATARLIDPFTLFQHAVGILTVDEFIRDQAPARADFAYTSMLLEAFAVELLLKCLLIIEKKDPPITHRLDKLFRQISHKKKRRLEELWEVQARPELTEFAKADGLPTNLPNAIVRCRDAFDRLRYHYEEPNKSPFYLGRLPHLLKMVILETKPEWRSRLAEERPHLRRMKNPVRLE